MVRNWVLQTGFKLLTFSDYVTALRLLYITAIETFLFHALLSDDRCVWKVISTRVAGKSDQQQKHQEDSTSYFQEFQPLTKVTDFYMLVVQKLTIVSPDASHDTLAPTDHGYLLIVIFFLISETNSFPNGLRKFFLLVTAHIIKF